MIPIDIQVSRSKVKVKGHASLRHLLQLITQECFAPVASNLVGRYSLMSTWPLLIFRSVGQRSVSKVKTILYMLGKGGISVLQTAIFWLQVSIPQHVTSLYPEWKYRNASVLLAQLYWDFWLHSEVLFLTRYWRLIWLSLFQLIFFQIP